MFSGMAQDTANLSVLWEAHFNKFELLFFAMPLLPVVLGILFAKTKSARARISLAMSAVIAIFLAKEMIAQVLRDMAQARKVESGEMTVVEGVVNTFHASVTNEDEFFYLGGIRFGYFPYRPSGGYSMLARDGGIIRGGQHLRVYYLPGANGPRIMRIDGATVMDK